MSDLKTIQIHFSKSKMAYLLCGCLLFIAVGVCFAINPRHFESFIARNPTFIFVSGIASVLFFGVVAFSMIKRLFDKTPALIISETGITDNSSGVGAGFIPWNDVKYVTESKIANKKFINIMVKHPEQYIARQKSLLKRKMMKSNFDLFHTVISISGNGLKIEYDDLKKVIEKAFLKATNR